MKKTWLLGLGFFSISLTWALYNAFVPLFLEDFIVSVFFIGFLMTIDNYFGLFLQPIIGRQSDKTNTKIGKRMPYLAIGIPLAAIFCIMIPLYKHEGLISIIGVPLSNAISFIGEVEPSLALLVTAMILMNLSMALYRSPTVSLMPDITAPEKRTQANGIINLMGGVGSILAFSIGSILYEQHITYPFIFSAILSFFALFMLLFFIKERQLSLHYRSPQTSEVDDIVNQVNDAIHERTTRLTKLKLALTKYKLEWTRSTIWLLLAIYFWFFSYQGIEALFTLYSTNRLGLTDGQASFMLTFFSLAFLATAIPAGFLGKKIGKKKTIMIGVIGLMIVFGITGFVENIMLIRILLILGGAFWACININSYPFVISLGKESSIGTRTGIYYIASSLAALSAPVLMGLFVDLIGYNYLFAIATIGFALALLFISLVNPNEQPKPSSI